ncbi:fibrinogen C domain-containing protein 1-like [Glandiceps talaboti]
MENTMNEVLSNTNEVLSNTNEVLSNTNEVLDECSSARDDEWKHNMETTMNEVLDECASARDEEWKHNMENTIEMMLQTLQSIKEDVQGLTHERARDCSDIMRDNGWTSSGIYRIKPDDGPAFNVYCDMDTDSGGWTVFQRRVDGSVDFYLDWADYKTGFGNLDGEHWLGNDKIYRLTNQGRQYELRVDLEDFDNNTAYAEYTQFSITDEANYYRLSLGHYNGNADDSLTWHNGMFFSTRDRDNDHRDSGNCAETFTGAWWYNTCHYSNLNGQYLAGQSSREGVVWYYWKGWESLKHVEMKIRPVL